MLLGKPSATRESKMEILAKGQVNEAEYKR